MDEKDVINSSIGNQSILQTSGAFIDSLKRNNRKIREDRASTIAEDTKIMYGREIQDLETSIRRMVMARENMLDLSPSDSQSLVLASDFDVKTFIEKDLKLGVDIRNSEIKLEIAKKRFEHLFGGQ